MLDFLGTEPRYRRAHDAIIKAMEKVLLNGPKTPDLKGEASTQQMGEAIAEVIR
jgi:tartrate dehydrogenase/decarboxylase/D-malate dehydrogenase